MGSAVAVDGGRNPRGRAIARRLVLAGARGGRLQVQLADLYDLPLDANVEAFVCDLATASALVGPDVEQRREALIVVEEPDGVSVGLYVDEAMRKPRSRFDVVCLLAEGVSHFVYFKFRADHREQVSELELELQAEVDKYALALLRDESPRLPSRSRRLRHRLFAAPRFADAAGTERGDRYRLALRMASRYTRSLERRFVERGDLFALGRELRRFYRLSQREKLDHIERVST